MNIFNGAVRAITKTAEATTSAAGAVGDAAVNGVIGGMRGVLTGVKTGVSGSHSTPGAALTLAAIGAAGLVEWPLLLGVGGAALAVHQINQRFGAQSPPTLAAVPNTAAPRRSAPAVKRAPARKTAKPAKSTAKRAPTRKTAKPAKSAARTPTGRGRSPAKR